MVSIFIDINRSLYQAGENLNLSSQAEKLKIMMGEQIQNFKHKRETKLSSINSTKARKEKIKTNEQTNKQKT